MSTLAWPLLLLMFGLILVAAEVFIPSGGILGLLAIGCLALGLWQAFRQSTYLGLRFLLADSLLLPMTIALVIYLWPRLPIANRVELQPPAPEEVGVSHSDQRLDHLIGQYGRALSPLRPSGVVDFDGRRLDALSEEGLIAAGALVLAVRIRAGQIIVRAADDEELPEVQSDLA
jgi:membrane-bound ClpP family serine protease